MAEQSQSSTQDPPIWKKVNPKTQGYLRAIANHPEEPITLIMSNKQPVIAVTPEGPIKKKLDFEPRNEKTFIAIKPDGVQRGLIGAIISRFEARGLKLLAIKLTMPGKELLEKHYADLKGEKFYGDLIEYMNSGPICAMIWEGRNAVVIGRALLGATNPINSLPGTIRGDFCIDTGRNICHGSDKVSNAKKEMELWFSKDEIMKWKMSQFGWIHEKNPKNQEDPESDSDSNKKDQKKEAEK